MSVKWLRGSDVNKISWDDCITHAFNGSVYGYSWFLDSVCWEWEALVADDYQMVMPLPIRKIVGFRTVVNPFLLPYVSIYSRVLPSAAIIQQFIGAIPYRQVKLTLLPFNGFPSLPQMQGIPTAMVSFDLIMDYDAVDQRFASLFDMNRYSGWEGHFSIARTQNLGEYLDFRAAVGCSKSEEMLSLKRAIGYSLRFKSAGIYAAFDKVNMPMAMLVMMKTENRLSVVDVAFHGDDCSRSGLFFILRQIIRINAESNFVLQFPGEAFYLSKQSKAFCLNGKQYSRGVLRFMKKGLH